ncbi:MAG: WD40 repeat domain-containing protein [Armatimonadetes bacterium]|nr:WD40 repeat domain-containing protein [Armatimonadota bacterium]
MSILIICECGAQLRTSEANAGQKGRCPKCGAMLVCPSTATAPELSVADEPPAMPEAPAVTEPPAAPEPPADDEPPAAAAEPLSSPTEPPAPARRAHPVLEAPPPEPWTVLRSWQAHSRAITAMVFNPDGRYLATAGADGVIKIWDMASAAAVVTMDPLPHAPVTLAFSGDGHRLATGISRPRGSGDQVPEPNVLVWDLAKKQQLMAFAAHRDSVNAVALNADGSVLVTGGDCLDEPDSPTVSFWDVATGEPLAGVRAADTSEVRELARTPDGTRVAAACWQTITFWDLTTFDLKVTVNSGSWDQFRCLTLSPDGRLVAGGCYEYIRVWDLTTSHTLGHLTGYNADVTSVSFCGDGAHLVGVSTPEGQWDPGMVKVWDAATHAECATLDSPTGAKVVKVGFSPKRKLIVTADNEGAICLWGLMED